MKKDTAVKTILVFLLLFFAMALIAEAKVYIDLEAPQVRRLPIAVEGFRNSSVAPATDEEAAIQKTIKAELLDALTNDLKFSNLFTLINKDAFIESAEKGSMKLEEIKFNDWRSIGADTLIKGEFRVEKDRLTVEIRLFDCVNEKEILAKRFVGGANNPRRLAHYFADQIYEELTGKKGVFATKLLFVSSKTGSKEIYISDYDGKNAKRLTSNRSINRYPQWSPDGKRFLYTSYKKGQPFLYMLDLTTGIDAVISNKPGINSGARFSPDGQKAALTVSTDKSPELFLLDLKTKEYKRLTDNHDLDVSPAWSPDGKRLAYVSNTSGNPHIFVLNLENNKTERLTFDGKYNASPAWSPDGRYVAYSRADAGPFNIWVKGLDNTPPMQLTFEHDNRTPSWSPDSRYIVFSRIVNGQSAIYVMSLDGSGLAKLPIGMDGFETSPAWSPYLQ